MAAFSHYRLRNRVSECGPPEPEIEPFPIGGRAAGQLTYHARTADVPTDTVPKSACGKFAPGPTRQARLWRSLLAVGSSESRHPRSAIGSVLGSPFG